MKAQLNVIRKKRKYSEEFKRQVVSDFESGKFSVLQLERLHGIVNVNIYNWIYKYSTFNAKGYRIVENNKSSNEKLKELEAKVKELESALGRKQIMIDYLEQMMVVAKDELGIDIKKNYNTPPSKGSDKRK